jgi:hypothetical protein
MIPQHVLDGLGPGQRVAVLTRSGGELQFLVHEATADAERIKSDAARDGSEVVATHLRDKEAILALVAGRERDVGGEG